MDDEPDAVHAMLGFLYTHHLNIPSSIKEDSKLSFCVIVYRIADKYSLPTLKEACSREFELRAPKTWNTKEFSAALAEIYRASSNTLDALRVTALNIATKSADTLLRPDNTSGGFAEMCRDTPGLATDLALALSTKLASEVRLKCPNQLHSNVGKAGVFSVSRDLGDAALIRCPHGSCPDWQYTFSKWKTSWIDKQ